ncbi:MAG: N-acetylglucosamine-6-phosphate deacetylase [Peptococcaceae bacterium]|nr:N-acetylglucosamine-6-phosphate deacetylase [Peptococcaceae bacterium]
MIDYLICGGELVTSSGTVPNSGLLVTRGKLAVPGALRPENLYAGLSCSIGRPKPGSPPPFLTKPLSDQKNCCCSGPCDQECVKIDASGLYIAPGFIDMHVHGGNGYDILDGSARAIREVAAFHARGGTTSFLATVVPAPRNIFEKTLSTINALTLRNTEGSQLLGAHLEGPFLNPMRSGAINPAYLREVNLEEMSELISLCEGTLKMVTVAPELPGCTDLIKMLAREGIVVAAGHSEASYEIALSSFKAGIRHAVHLFNASAPLHHREPGLVGAVLACREISAEIIADGHHLHPSMLKLLHSVKGRRGLTLATDAISAAGLPDGEYLFNERKVTMHGRKITLPDNSMAGSSLTMIEAVKNMVNLAGIPLHEAVRMASLNPARVLGIENTKGALAPGMDADLVLLDKDLNVRLTMAGGEIVYSSLVSDK